VAHSQTPAPNTSQLLWSYCHSLIPSRQHVGAACGPAVVSKFLQKPVVHHGNIPTGTGLHSAYIMQATQNS
jgi:hypothetical protein